jgi:hypothetical protein
MPSPPPRPGDRTKRLLSQLPDLRFLLLDAPTALETAERASAANAFALPIAA